MGLEDAHMKVSILQADGSHPAIWRDDSHDGIEGLHPEPLLFHAKFVEMFEVQNGTEAVRFLGYYQVG